MPLFRARHLLPIIRDNSNILSCNYITRLIFPNALIYGEDFWFRPRAQGRSTLVWSALTSIIKYGTHNQYISLNFLRADSRKPWKWSP